MVHYNQLLLDTRYSSKTNGNTHYFESPPMHHVAQYRVKKAIIANTFANVVKDYNDTLYIEFFPIPNVSSTWDSVFVKMVLKPGHYTTDELIDAFNGVSDNAIITRDPTKPSGPSPPLTIADYSFTTVVTERYHPRSPILSFDETDKKFYITCAEEDSVTLGIVIRSFSNANELFGFRTRIDTAIGYRKNLKGYLPLPVNLSPWRYLILKSHALTAKSQSKYYVGSNSMDGILCMIPVTKSYGDIIEANIDVMRDFSHTSHSLIDIEMFLSNGTSLSLQDGSNLVIELHFFNEGSPVYL